MLGVAVKEPAKGVCGLFKTWENSFPVRFSHIGLDRKLKVPVLCGFLQDSAAQHIEALGCGLESLHENNHGWVLSKLHLKIKQMPEFDETVVVTTWQPGTERVFALRDYRVTSEEGELIALGTSYWLAVDLGKKRILRPDRYLSPEFYEEGRRAMISNPSRMKAIVEGQYSFEIEAHYHDIDMNGHVNNVKYLEWLLNSVPLRVGREYTLSEIEVSYVCQSCHGDRVRVISDCDGGSSAMGDMAVFRHTIYLSCSGTAVCNARTVWVKKI